MADLFSIGDRSVIKVIPNGNVYNVEIVCAVQGIENNVMHVKNAPVLTSEVEVGHIEGVRCLVSTIVHVQKLLKQYLDKMIMAASKKIGLEMNNSTLRKTTITIMISNQGKTCRICQGTIPSHKKFIDWARFGIGEKVQVAPEYMECALDDFFNEYIQREKHLHMVSPHNPNI